MTVSLPWSAPLERHTSASADTSSTQASEAELIKINKKRIPVVPPSDARTLLLYYGSWRSFLSLLLRRGVDLAISVPAASPNTFRPEKYPQGQLLHHLHSLHCMPFERHSLSNLGPTLRTGRIIEEVSITSCAT